MTMYEKLKVAAQSYPSTRALTLNGKHITFKQLLENIDRTFYKCINLGIQPHDKVALVLPNIFESVFLLYALN